MNNGSSSHKGQLFSLEQQLFTPNKSPKTSEESLVQAQAFDMGEAIFLQYNQDFYPTAQNAESFSNFPEMSIAAAYDDEVRYIEFDSLPSTKRGVAYEYGPIRARLKELWPKLALTYSAFLSVDGKNIFNVGWNHALVLKKRNNLYYADSVYVHGTADSPEKKVYTVEEDLIYTFDQVDAINKSIKQGKHKCKEHKTADCSWKKFKVSDRIAGEKIDRIITWGVTSCSVACLWNTNAETIIISHMNAGPPIPVAWMAVEEGIQGGTFKVIVSSHPGNSELAKLKSDNLPHSDVLASAIVLPRGPLKLSSLNDNSAFLTHPYAGIDLTQLSTKGAIFEGVVGYNNDPTLPVEMPPFHTVLSGAYDEFKSNDAERIVTTIDKLLKGDYGNGLLFNHLIASIDSVDALAGRRYRSALLTNLLGRVKPKTDLIQTLKNKERSVCILVELINNPKTPNTQIFQDAVLKAWNAYQLKFSIALSDYETLRGKGVTHQLSLANDFTSSMEYDSVSYQVESFEENYQEKPEPPATPVNVTVLSPEEQPLRYTAPRVESASAFDVIPATGRAADADAFEADLRAILSGEKTYEPTQQQTSPTPPPVQNQEEQTTTANPHDIFDQGGKSMAYANSFDLGTVSLQQRFDELDRLLDEQEKKSVPTVQTVSTPLQFDDMHLVHDFTVMSEASSSSFDLRYEVPLIPQQTGISCWAAATAMLVAWRDNIIVNLSEIASGSGSWAKYKSGLQLEDPSMFKIWELLTKPAQSYTVEGFQELLMDLYGPILVASATPGKHVRVVTGLVGDGTPDGTMVYINDPWKVGMTSFQMPNPGAQYTETYREFVQKQAMLASGKSTSTAIFIAYLPAPAPNFGKQMDIDDDDW